MNYSNNRKEFKKFGRMSILSSLIIMVVILLMGSCKETAQYKALLITGQNNHNWKVSSPVLKQILEQSGLFSVKVETSPAAGQKMDGFKPDFSKYDVVVLDYNGDSWPESTNKAFEEYVSQGGGVVVYHAANNSFPEWKEYNKMIGLGGWGNRSEKDGPYVYYRRDSLITDNTPGPGGSHGAQYEYAVKHRKTDHPITKGLPSVWMHGKDELYNSLRGPAQNMEILATAFDNKDKGGTGRDEPILFTIKYGKGRVFHTVLGDAGSEEALKCAGFIVTLQRGAEWAATGNVTQLVPVDFPNSVSVILWDEYKQLTFNEVVNGIKNYEIGRTTKYITSMQERLREAKGSVEILQEYEKEMVKLLSGQCSDEGKKALLRELSWMGSSYCLPTLEKLKNETGIKDEVQYALARLAPGK